MTTPRKPRLPVRNSAKDEIMKQKCYVAEEIMKKLTMEVPMGSWACPEEAVPEPMPKAECALVPPTIPPVPAMVPAAIPQAPIEDIPEYRELWPVIWDHVELLIALPGQMEVQFIKNRLDSTCSGI